MADRIKNYQQEADQITTLKEIRTDLGVTPSSYTPDATVVTKDRVVTFSQAEEELAVLGDIEKGVKQQVVKGGIADKRITNIEKLLQGNLYDYQTDSNSAYTKTVLAGAMPYASLNEVGGKTLVWNQILRNGNFADASGWTAVNCSLSVADNVATITFDGSNATVYIASGTVTESFNLSHKYYICGDFTVSGSGVSAQVFMYNIGTTIDSVNFPATESANFIHQARISNGNSGTDYRFRIQINTNSVAGTVQVKNAFICDLTLMFGAGNEPSTVAEFESQFPAQYYPYNAGTLLSAGVTEVVSKGKNLADYSGGVGYPSDTASSTATKRIYEVGKWVKDIAFSNAYTSGRVSATIGDNSISIYTVTGGYGVGIPFNCDENTAYSFSFIPQNSKLCAVMWYAKDGTFISNKIIENPTSAGYTSPANATQGVLLLTTNQSNVQCSFTNIQIEKSATATTYSPYKKITYPIPAEVQALEGYGWSAGSVYNYVDFERKVFVQNVARVDLGSLTFTLSKSALYVSTMPLGKAVSEYVVPNMIIPGYIPITAHDITGPDGATPSPDKTFAFGSTKNLYINNLNFYRDIPAFTNAMNGVYLYYELATPVETDISEYLTDDNLIQVESGGTLTFENVNGDDYRIDVPSAETYMVDLQSALGE